MKHLAVLLILLLAIGTLMAQVTLELTPSPETYNLFAASYVDPTDPMSQPVLFTLKMWNESDTEIMDYSLHITIRWNESTVLLANGLATANESLPPSGSPSTSLPARSYNSRVIISNTNNYFDADFDFDEIMSSSSDFEDAILDTGRFPDGRYDITITFDAPGITAQPASMTFNVVSPISIQLLYPGTQIGGQVMPYMETFPNFVWASNLSCYTFRIWDLEGMANVNAEEIENMEPMFSMPCQGFTTLPYPAEAPSLEVAKTYAWQVVGGVTSPGDLGGLENSIKSPVFVFQVASPNDNEVYNQILANFLNNLGGQFGAIYELLNQGYTPTGTIVWNGQEMSFEELNAIIIQVLSGELELHDLIIE